MNVRICILHYYYLPSSYDKGEKSTRNSNESLMYDLIIQMNVMLDITFIYKEKKQAKKKGKA